MHRKRMLDILSASFVINLSAAALAGIALISMFSLGSSDWLIMLPVFILLFPIAILQPWYAAAITMIIHEGAFGAIVPVAITNIFVTTFIYYWFDHHGWLNTLWRRAGGWRLPCVIGVLALLAMPFSYLRIIDYPPLYHKPPPLIADLITTDIKNQNAASGHSVWMINDWLWRGEVDRKGLFHLCKDLNLSPSRPEDFPMVYYDEGPYWWKPVKGPTIKAYANDVHDGKVKRFVYLQWDMRTGIFYAMVREDLH